MMSNDWSIILSEKGQGKVNFNSHVADVEYDLTVSQAVLVPNLFSAECCIEVIHPNSCSIVIELLNKEQTLY